MTDYSDLSAVCINCTLKRLPEVSPIWLRQKSSVCTCVIERLYGNSHPLNDAGQ